MKWDHKFDRLATYNGEVNRGIAHTDEHKAEMRVLQDEYNDLLDSGVVWGESLVEKCAPILDRLAFMKRWIQRWRR